MGNGSGGMPDFSPDDFFKFFGGGGGGYEYESYGSNGRQHRPPKSRTEDAQLDVYATLADLYNGKTVKITSTRKKLCGLCDGRGVKKGAKKKQCGVCNGQGFVRQIRRVGPGMVTQDYVDCTTCKGTGHTHRAKDKCKKCQGTTTQDETKILEFVIEKGSHFDDRVVLKGESDEEYGKVTGDVVLVILEKGEESHFERDGNHLHTDLHITLAEALCGFKDKVVLKHLDGRLIKISTPTGKVLRPNQYLEITNEGFPIKGTSKKGNLYLKVIIEFPPDFWFSEKSELNNVKNILPTVKGSKPSHTLDDVDTEDQNELGGCNVDEVDFKVLDMNELPEFTVDDEEYEEDGEDFVPGCAQQ